MATAITNTKQVEAAKELLVRRRARRGLIAFTEFTFQLFKSNWHHELIATTLERVYRTVSGTLLPGEQPTARIVIITVPPRHGKSELASVRFPAWVMGQNPQLQVIHCSYSFELSRTFSSACRQCMQGEEYQRLWPCKFASDGSAQWQLAGKQNGRPNWISAGVGGGINGQGANILIIDDPIKNAEEADSIVMRDKNWNWYESTARSRLQPGGIVVLILTRWHEDDLAGRMIAKAKEDKNADQVEIINLPLVNTAAEGLVEGLPAYKALWESAYDHVWAAGTKATVSPKVWNAVYQQRPRALEGNVIRMEWFKFWQKPGNNLPPVRMNDGVKSWEIAPVTLPATFDDGAQSWDMAFKDKKDSSFVVGQVWGRVKADKYLLYQKRERLTFTGSCDGVKELTSMFPEINLKYVEDKANGPAIIDTLRTEIGGFWPIEPQGTKEARLEASAVDFKGGNVYVPHPSISPWVWDYISELVAAPNGMFMDQADATSQYLNEIRKSGGGFFAYLQGQNELRQEAELQQMRESAVDELLIEGVVNPTVMQVDSKVKEMFV